MNALTPINRTFTAAKGRCRAMSAAATSALVGLASKQRYRDTMLAGAAFAFAGNASAQYDIGAPTTGTFGKLGSFMQSVVDFIDGPTVAFIAVISIFAVAVLIAIAPKSGPVAFAARVAIGLIIALNISTWVLAFKNGG